MPIPRLYTRSQDHILFQRCLIALDLTRMDFRSDPGLDFYIKHWFVDVDDLMDYLVTVSNQTITLITTNLLADIAYHVLRRIYPQIVQIMIIGKRRREYENGTYFPDAESLVKHLSSVLRDRRRLNITFEAWPVERTSYNLNRHTGPFLWHTYFHNLLSRVESTVVTREEMLQSVQAFHTRQTDKVQRSCEEFQQSYHSRDIIKWYTRESFFYLLLNRTLRSQDINHIFAMRYVTSDLENFIRDHCHENPSVTTVYRGQQMHTYEIEEIAANVGGLIGLTTFWSTSRSKEVALRFTMRWPSGRIDPVEGVLFAIQIPSHVKPGFCLDVSQLTATEFELEVLFSLHSIFRVERMTRNGNDPCWYVDLTLIDYHDEQYRAIMHPWHFLTNDTIGQRCFFTPQPPQSNESFSRSMTLENGPFLQFHLMLDMMLRLDPNHFARGELLEVCRQYSSNSSKDLAQIDKFEGTYDPKDAITWYTKDTFLYRLMNAWLRSEEINLTFKLRYFIHDLHNQLAQVQTTFLRHLSPKRAILELYRGLQMNLSEIHQMQQAEGKLVSNNSFLSTTSDYEAALSFAGNGNVDTSVIYRIEVDTTLSHSVPFAQIDNLSIFKDEDEVLFSMGAVFRVGPTRQRQERLWTIDLTLTPTEDEQWNMITAHFKTK